MESITVIHGDTDLMKFGVGTFASRAAVTAGSAVLRASERVRERARALAGRHLEAAPADIVLAEGRAHVWGSRTDP